MIACGDTEPPWTAMVVVVNEDVIFGCGWDGGECVEQVLCGNIVASGGDLLGAWPNILLVISFVEDLALEWVELVVCDVVVAHDVDFRLLLAVLNQFGVDCEDIGLVPVVVEEFGAGEESRTCQRTLSRTGSAQT